MWWNLNPLESRLASGTQLKCLCSHFLAFGFNFLYKQSNLRLFRLYSWLKMPVEMKPKMNHQICSFKKYVLENASECKLKSCHWKLISRILSDEIMVEIEQHTSAGWIEGWFWRFKDELMGIGSYEARCLALHRLGVSPQYERHSSWNRSECQWDGCAVLCLQLQRLVFYFRGTPSLGLKTYRGVYMSLYIYITDSLVAENIHLFRHWIIYSCK